MGETTSSKTSLATRLRERSIVSARLKDADMSTKITSHCDLIVYRKSFDSAMKVFELSTSFPRAETYSLIDQMRRSSRSVSANIAEAWRKRRYERSFCSKLSDAEAEAAETQVWIQFAVRCGYLANADGSQLYAQYNEVIAILVSMINNSSKWALRAPRQ